MRAKIIILIIYLLVANSFYSLIGYENSYTKVLALIAIPFSMICWSRVKLSGYDGYRYVLFFLSILLLSFVTSYIWEGQSLIESLYGTVTYIALLFLYFVLHYFRVSEKDIINVLKWCAVVYISIIFIQQFSDIRLFGRREGDEIRMGLHRYLIIGDRLCLFPMFFYYVKWLKDSHWKSLLLSLFFLLGILLTTERILIFGTIIILLFIFVLNMSSKGLFKKIILLMLILITVPYFVSELNKLEGNLIEISRDQYDNAKYYDDIRYTSALYYMNEVNNTWPKKLFGLGIPGGHSSYENRIEGIEQQLHLYRIDVGIIGDISTNGIIFVIGLLAIMLIILRKPNVPQYIKYTIILFLLIWILNSSTDTSYRYVLWPLIFYIIDIHSGNDRNKLTKIIE
jgi:hypothetical protein